MLSLDGDYNKTLLVFCGGVKIIMDQTLLEEIKDKITPLLTKKDIELVELRMARARGRSILRFLVDKPSGITLDECTRLNQELGRALDQENIIQESYILEVSSPGLDRPLEATRDFQRCYGQVVKIVLRQGIDRQNVWEGTVVAVDDRNLTIQTEAGKRLQIPRANIARARLVIEFD